MTEIIKEVSPINLIELEIFRYCKIFFMISGKKVVPRQIEIERINSSEKKVLKFIVCPY